MLFSTVCGVKWNSNGMLGISFSFIGRAAGNNDNIIYNLEKIREEIDACKIIEGICLEDYMRS